VPVSLVLLCSLLGYFVPLHIIVAYMLLEIILSIFMAPQHSSRRLLGGSLLMCCAQLLKQWQCYVAMKPTFRIVKVFVVSYNSRNSM